jgi:hypothetical protein
MAAAMHRHRREPAPAAGKTTKIPFSRRSLVSNGRLNFDQPFD